MKTQRGTGGMNKIPDISIIIPNYNYEAYIEECIQSVEESDFDHGRMEIIIVDDASTDNSVQLISKLKKQISVPLHLIKHPINLGLARARNSGVKNASGKYLFLLDSDNYIGKECLSRHFHYLNENEALSACYAPIQKFDNETKELQGIFSNEPYDYNRLSSTGNYIDAMSMIKREDLVEAGMYDEKMPLSGWEDYELWLRFGMHNKSVAFMGGEPLSFYRTHAGSMINKMKPVNYELLQLYLNAKYNIHIGNSGALGLKTITYLDHAITQVFWAGPEMQFSEIQSVSQNIPLGNEDSRASFLLPQKPENISFLRFDIGKSIGLLNIHQILLKNSSGKLVWTWNPDDLEFKNDLLLIENQDLWPGRIIQLSFSEDPHFIVKVGDALKTEPGESITVEISLFGLDGFQREGFGKFTKPLTYISRKQISALEQQVSDLQGEKLHLSRELNTAKEQLIKIQADNEISSQNIQSQKQAIDLLNTSLAGLTADKKSLSSDKDLLTDEIRIKNEFMLRLNSEKDVLNSESLKKEKQVSHLSEKIALLEPEIHKHEVHIAELLENRKHLEKQLTNQVHLAEKHTAALAQTEEKLHAEEAAHISNKTNLEKQMQAVKSHADELALQIRQSAEQIGRISAEKENYAQKNEELIHLQNELKSSLADEMDRSMQHAGDLAIRNAELHAQLEKSDELIRSQKEKEIAWNELKREKDKIIEELKQLIQHYEVNFDQKNALQIGFNRVFKKSKDT
jgi:glycosyltransferase involved in cell wall biosynthesis